jgi:hypothetical protein
MSHEEFLREFLIPQARFSLAICEESRKILLKRTHLGKFEDVSLKEQIERKELKIEKYKEELVKLHKELLELAGITELPTYYFLIL